MANHAVLMAGLKGIHSLGRGTGAHRIATILRKEGWDVEVLDFMVSWTNEELIEFFQSRLTSDTKFVGYSYTFHTWESRFGKVFDWIKTNYPDIKIIVGGVGVETCPLDAHYYINNYAEYAILEIIKNILGTATDKLKYTLHRSGKLIRANLDYPAYPLPSLQVSFENRDFIDPRETLVVETCRGCKFKCDFCTYPILGVTGDHSITAESYISHLKEDYERWGVTNWNVADETFNDRSEKIEKFANATAQLNFKPNLTGFIRADLLVSRKHDWPMLQEMGFWGQWYGIESFNWPSAKSVGKGMKPDRLKEGLLEVKDYFQKHGNYNGTMSFIIGLPYETEQTVNDAWTWLKNNWEGQSAIYYALYIPKSEYTEELNTLSTSWQSRGYTEMSDEVSFVPTATGLSGPGTYFVEGLKSGVRWKTEYLDFEKAHKMVDQFYRFSNNYFAVHNFSMGHFRMAFERDEEWLGVPKGRRSMWLTADKAVEEFQRQYVIKKLNHK